jgi:hypothetical protein
MQTEKSHGRDSATLQGRGNGKYLRRRKENGRKKMTMQDPGWKPAETEPTEHDGWKPPKVSWGICRHPLKEERRDHRRTARSTPGNL